MPPDPTPSPSAPGKARPWQRLLRWLEGWADLGAGDADTRRRRPLALSGSRALLVIVTCTLATVLAVAGMLAALHQARAQQASQTALVALQEVLDEVRDELDAIARDGALQGELPECTAAVTAALVRHSLQSEWLVQVMVQSPDGQRVCGPLGPMLRDTDLREQTRGDINLYTRQSIANALVAARPIPDGRVLKAEIDRRAFTSQLIHPRRLREIPDLSRVLAAVSIDVLAPNGQLLASLLGTDLADREAAVPWLRQVVPSQRYGLTVAADIHRAALAAAAAAYMPAWALAGLLLGAATVLVMWRKVMLRARLVHRIAGGLRKRQFEPWVQPIVELQTGHCVGGEVLMRWQHPQRGVVSPGEFIEEAERSGLINDMSDLVMNLAAYRLGGLGQRHPQLYFSINVTPGQLARSDFAQRLAEVFRADTLPAAQVFIELTERDIVDAAASQALGHLRDAGWRIALDDFGTGQSSLALLERLRIDRIKIDQSFVRTIDSQTVRRPVLDAIIALATQLGVPLIAEGVETREQWDYLQQRGVTYAQGYLIARPMPIDAFGRWLDNQVAEMQGQAEVVRPAALSGGLSDDDALGMCQAMRAPHAPPSRAGQPGGGLDIRDRRWRLRLYANCFVGREAVDWIVQRERVSRAEAVRMGRRLVALGLMAHVVGEHDFEDADLYYVLAHFAGPNTQPVHDTHREIAQVLRAAARGEALPGLALGSHLRGVALHRRCATGAEWVRWMCQRWGLSPGQAVQVGAMLMRQGALRHVFDDRPFDAGHELYRP
jgi:sensor c-di-GMP phosphodiesterase-like protein